MFDYKVSSLSLECNLNQCKLIGSDTGTQKNEKRTAESKHDHDNSNSDDIGGSNSGSDNDDDSTELYIR